MVSIFGNKSLTFSFSLFPARLWDHECDSCCDQLCADRHVSTSQGLFPRLWDAAHTVDSGYWGNEYIYIYAQRKKLSIYLLCTVGLCVVVTQHLCFFILQYVSGFLIVLVWLIIIQGMSCFILEWLKHYQPLKKSRDKSVCLQNSDVLSSLQNRNPIKATFNRSVLIIYCSFWATWYFLLLLPIVLWVQ